MTVHAPGQGGTAQQPAPGDGADRPGRLLPGWAKVLVVVAHPDDESFGLGAIISQMTATGAAVHILCYTHGEASMLNENQADLDTERETELRHASTQLAAASVTLLGYPDGGLAAIPPTALAAHAVGLAARHRPDGLLVFDDTGVTGHPDHRAATAHTSQISPSAVVWRRWQLQGDCEHLRWLLPAPAAGAPIDQPVKER